MSVHEVNEIRRTKSPLAPPVLLPRQRVAEPRAAFELGVRVEFVEFLEGQESRGNELVLPARAFQGRLRCRVALEIASSPGRKHRRGVLPHPWSVLLLTIGES